MAVTLGLQRCNQMVNWTEEHLRSAVIDAATLKRGQQLAIPANWRNLATSDRALWGECQGSGSKPYQVIIDTSGPAFKCSCPSRTFPCKHGAGLMVLAIQEKGSFGTSDEPEWVSSWLNKRGEKHVAKNDEPVSAKAPPDPESQAKREALRYKRMDEGMADLERWLLDAMRTGMAALQTQYGAIEEQASRLVDAQLPGLATRLRSIDTSKHKETLSALGELYLLARIGQRSAALSADAQEEIAQQLGINIKKEKLKGERAGVADHWWVLGQVITSEDRLTQRRTWFMGRNSSRYALIIDHAFGSQGFAATFITGAVYEGTMYYFPGLDPLRATAQELHLRPEVGQWNIRAASPSEAMNAYATAVAGNPWLRQFPTWLTNVVPEEHKDQWYLRHDEGLMPMQCADDEGWSLAARSGGRPIHVFGEWTGHRLLPIHFQRAETLAMP